MLDDIGSPGTVASNGPRYFGFVIGASLPAAAAAERLMLAWDQCASSFDNSPVAATLERVAAGWVLDVLDLPRESAVGFGTSATACTLSCLAAARRSLLARKGWDFDNDGLTGAPEVKVVVSELVHITVKKALRLLGFGMNKILFARVNERGQVDPDRLPPLDDMTSFVCRRVRSTQVNSIPSTSSFRRPRPRAHGFMWMRRSACGRGRPRMRNSRKE
jgi:glutamate/tyrosine decarboxylase-like PLP-dependent enzyme